MKTPLILAILILSRAFAQQPAERELPCKPKDTVCNTIVATRQLLAGYQKAISEQIARQQAAYAAIAQAAEQGRRADIENKLRTERTHRAETMADDFIQRNRPLTHWKDYLLDYAAQDLKANRELLELDSLDGSRFLEGVQNLQIDFDKLQSLDKVLESLNQKKSVLAGLKDLAAVGQDTKTEFDKLVCDGLKQDLASKQSAKQAADNAKDAAKSAALDLEIKAIQKQRTAKSCKN